MFSKENDAFREHLDALLGRKEEKRTGRIPRPHTFLPCSDAPFHRVKFLWFKARQLTNSKMQRILRRNFTD
jgi:hypothetical protein